MDQESFITLLVLAGIGYAIYLYFYGRKIYRETSAQNQLEAEVEAVQQGMKPMGQPMSHTFGSAYLMSPAQAQEAGIGFNLDDFGRRFSENDLGYLLFGTVIRAINSTDKTVFAVLDQPSHALTVAPTRSGKGTCVVIPNLLIYGGSVIVNDIKGENYAVTHRWRARTGHDVYKVAPFDDDSDQWNPFDILLHSDDVWDDAKHMAELLLPDMPGKDEFWTNGARNLLTGLILYIHQTAPNEKRTLSYLRDLLTQDEEGFDETLAEMANSESKAAARSANVFQRADIKVQSGIMSTLDSELSFLDSDRLANCTEDSSFNFKELKEKLVSIYLVIPPERLRTYAPFVRLFMGLAALELKRTKTKPEFPVLLMLDEFPAMGRMKVIEDEISFLAGYDVRLWLFAQDLKQLASIYGDKAQSIIANCAVKQFFGVADEETARLVSFMCGSTTVPSISVSNTSGVRVESRNESIGRSARPLFDPNEVMTMDSGLQFLFYQGRQPIQSAKLSYLEHPRIFSDKDGPVFDDNPYHQ